jgi:SAM-dependent methyltransferase
MTSPQQPVARPLASCKRANYGIDAPDVVLRFFLIGMAGFVISAACFFALKRGLLPWARFLIAPFLNVGFCFVLTALVMVWGSKIGKLHLRDRVLNALQWRGDELVLDVGCGHGLMLIGAAKRLRGGKAIGLDLWQKEDQAGNSREATWQNVEIEGVADRVELKDGDARALPFADSTFDVIVSSWALHNIYDQAGRETAVREIVRVLKPGGRLALLDIRHTKEYARLLQTSQMRDVKRTGPNFTFVIPSFTLTATKPG